ncbi:MAG: 16S rRNA (cytosine(1402)-N(4))-methyltransferase RsmH [bacterium]
MATLTLMSDTEHLPVLAPELVGLLDPHPGERALDLTFGGGGHARLVAQRIGGDGTLICVDRDPAAADRFAALEPDLECDARFIRADFADALDELAADAADGERFDCIYMDLGISSLQLDAPERGFSYASDAPLDMRMDPGQAVSALEVVNDWPEDRLAAAIREHGEERHARSIAREIVRSRPLATTAELVDVIRQAVPPAYRFGRGHPAKRTFQAIRIAVNDELGAIDRALPAAWDLLEIGGRIGAISFHSLEDRRVKRFFADRARECICPPELPVCRCGRQPEAELATRKAVTVSPQESERNPRSRSARLRVARKLSDGRPGIEAGRL